MSNKGTKDAIKVDIVDEMTSIMRAVDPFMVGVGTLHSILSNAVLRVLNRYLPDEPEPWTPKIGDVMTAGSNKRIGRVIDIYGGGRFRMADKHGGQWVESIDWSCPATPAEEAEFYKEPWTPKVGDVVRLPPTTQDPDEYGVAIFAVVKEVSAGAVMVITKGGETRTHGCGEVILATPAEEAEFFTLKFNGKRFRLYWDRDKDLRIAARNGHVDVVVNTNPSDSQIIRIGAFLAGIGITADSPLIMPYDKSGGEYDPPVEAR